MRSRELQKCRQRLIEMRSRLVGEVNELEDEALRPTSLQAADPQSDPGSGAAAEGVAMALLDAEGRTLAEIDSALERLESDAFGRCATCRESIAPSRINALPYARHCTSCAHACEDQG
jgi:DnaK suppressor protein